MYIAVYTEKHCIQVLMSGISCLVCWKSVSCSRSILPSNELGINLLRSFAGGNSVRLMHSFANILSSSHRFTASSPGAIKQLTVELFGGVLSTDGDNRTGPTLGGSLASAIASLVIVRPYCSYCFYLLALK